MLEPQILFNLLQDRYYVVILFTGTMPHVLKIPLYAYVFLVE